MRKPAGALTSAGERASSLRSVGLFYRWSVVIPLPPQPPSMVRQPLPKEKPAGVMRRVSLLSREL